MVWTIGPLSRGYSYPNVWLLFDYSNETTATFSLWTHLDYKDDKLSTMSRPRQLEAKDKDFCPQSVLEVEDSLRRPHPSTWFSDGRRRDSFEPNKPPRSARHWCMSRDVRDWSALQWVFVTWWGRRCRRALSPEPCEDRRDQPAAASARRSTLHSSNNIVILCSATRPYASAVLAVVLCLSVCHKPTFCLKNGYTNRDGFWHGSPSFLPPILHTVL